LTPSDLKRELLKLGKTSARQTASDRLNWQTHRLSEADLCGAQPLSYLRGVWSGKCEAQLEPAPDRSVEQLRVICGRDSDDIRRQGVDLQQQRTDQALDLARLMYITPLFPNYVELVKEQHAPAGTYVLEEAGKADRSLTEVTRDDCFVAHGKERNGKFAGDSLSKRGLAITWRPDKEHPVARLETVRAKKVSPVLLLDQLSTSGDHRLRQHQTLERSLG